MATSLAQVFWESAMTSFGSNILLFGFIIMFLAILFVITKQSLSSSLLLGVVALDGIRIVANEPFIDLLLLLIKILVLGVIGYGIATAVFKK